MAIQRHLFFLSTLITLNHNYAQQDNFVFIIIDDLGFELLNEAITPHIDNLKIESVSFEKAYAQSSICGPSRASILTGERPSETMYLRAIDSMENQNPDAKALPELLKENGYVTISNGKVFHKKTDFEAQSWTGEKAWRPSSQSPNDYATQPNIDLDIGNLPNCDSWGRGSAYEHANVQDVDYWDGKISEKSVLDIQELGSSEDPFFLAVGFMKPHLPFNCPQYYRNLYNSSNLSVTNNQYIDYCSMSNLPFERANEHERYCDFEGSVDGLSYSDLQELKASYSACVSYVDSQIGKLIEEMKSLNLLESTHIIILSDHGYSLAHNGNIGKAVMLEENLRTPLIWHVPTNNKNRKKGINHSLIELFDIYSTVKDFAKLTNLSNSVQCISFRNHLDGQKENYNKIESIAFRNQYIRYPNEYESHETVTTLTIHSVKRKSQNKLEYNCEFAQGQDLNSLDGILTPNPSNGNVAIQFNQRIQDNITVRLFNIGGEQIFTSEIPKETRVIPFDLTHLASGVYYINFTSSLADFTKAILIVN